MKIAVNEAPFRQNVYSVSPKDLAVMSLLRKYTQRAGLALLASLVLSCALFAQEFRGTLTGQVTDPSGATVAGAQVQAVNNATQQTYPTTTTDKGVYFIPYMLPATYTVTVTATGFKTQVQDNVVLQASSSRGLNFTFQLGTETQTVEVTGAPPLIETANGSGGTVLTGQQLENLPMNGRQVYTLLGTTPGS